MKVKGMYKIHGLQTANGERKSIGTSKFYETYGEALQAAERCVANDGCTIVIYKAHKVVDLERPPIVVMDVE